MTGGEGIMKLSPVAAFVVVSAHSLVLFLFSSQGIKQFLTDYGLPTIPLVPVSSSQAIVGAVIGVGLLKGGRSLRWRVLGGISSGWVVTPVIAGLICFISLFFIQNVFQQQTYRSATYSLTHHASERIDNFNIPTKSFVDIVGQIHPDGIRLNLAFDATLNRTYAYYAEQEALRIVNDEVIHPTK